MDLAARIETHLRTIVEECGHRPPGSPANRRATDYVWSVLRDAGLAVDAAPIRARWWLPGRAAITVGGVATPIEPPPFCRSADVAGPAVLAATVGDLDGIADGAVIVLRGDLAQPVLPKAFPFVQFPEQVALIEALEAARPAAVLAVVPDDAAQPVFEDPALAFPYASVGDTVGRGIAAGAAVRLEVEATIAEGDGVNLAAGTFSGRRTVVSAHVDSKIETAGALDNGAGVAVLLALAEGGLDDLGPVELALFNGEDHYAAPGEQAWLARRDLDEIDLVVNVDGPGLRGHLAAVSTLGAGPELDRAVKRALAATPGTMAGEPWFESDHAVFAMRGIPAIAITTAAPFDLLKRITHAPDDGPARIDPAVLADVARFIRSFLGSRVGVPAR